VTAAAPSAWFVRPRALPTARMRLICLPHAGAGATSFHAWGGPLQAAGIELRAVQYPGRENRIAEPLIDSAGRMVGALAEAWPALAGDRPCALFGHSMGALLAYELAAELARRGAANAPGRLFLSGRNPPESPPKLPPLHPLPDDAFVREVARRYGNLPPEILAEPEMLALVIPILRADFKLVDTYAWSGAAPLDTPLTIFGGTQDPWTDDDALSGWGRHTRRGCRVRRIPGGHFFHQDARAAVIENVLAELPALP
jgi:surfactin synthase thioesterase subunit